MHAALNIAFLHPSARSSMCIHLAKVGMPYRLDKAAKPGFICRGELCVPFPLSFHGLPRSGGVVTYFQGEDMLFVGPPEAASCSSLSTNFLFPSHRCTPGSNEWKGIQVVDTSSK